MQTWAEMFTLGALPVDVSSKSGAVVLLNGPVLGKEVDKLARSGPKTGEIIAKTIEVSGGR